MQISWIQIKNFRNFMALDMRLGKHAVIVGENRAGKSNLLHALRLLNPSLPDTARQLREEDFWDGLPRPLTPEDRFLSLSILRISKATRSNSSASPNTSSFLSRWWRGSPIFLSACAGSEDANDFDFSIYGGDRAENVVHLEIVANCRSIFCPLCAMRKAIWPTDAARRSARSWSKRWRRRMQRS